MPLTTYTAGDVLTAASLNANFTFAAGSGSVVQVLSTIKQDTFSTSSQSYVDVTGLSVSITPTSASNKIFVVVSVTGGSQVDAGSGAITIARGGINIFGGTAAGNRTLGVQSEVKDNGRTDTYGLSVLDSPATTSATTYAVRVLTVNPGNMYVNRSHNDTNNASHFRSASSITVMEVTP